MDIRSFGDSEDKIRLRFDGAILSARANERAAELVEDLAHDIHRRVIAHIDTQDLPWAPLSPEYKAWKQRHGLNENTWIASGVLKDQIEIRPGIELTLANGKTVRIGWMVGIFSDSMHPIDPLDPSKGEIPTWIIAETLEFGSPRTGIEPRPIFRMSIRRAREAARMKRPPTRPAPQIPKRPLFGPSIVEALAAARKKAPPASRGTRRGA